MSDRDFQLMQIKAELTCYDALPPAVRALCREHPLNVFPLFRLHIQGHSASTILAAAEAQLKDLPK